MEEIKKIHCSFCKQVIPENSYFCPQCGKELKINPANTTIAKQIIIYFVSFFLPPFGLGYAWKYIRYEDRKSKIIGSVAIILTLFSILLSLWMMDALLSPLRDQLNQLNDLGL